MMWVTSASQVAQAAAPDTTITTTPTNPSGPDVTFEFSGTTGTTRFECNLDSFGYELCASPTTYSGLINGNHTFEVRAFNANNEVDPTPASFTWTVDDGTPNQTRTWYLDGVTFDSGAVATGSFDYNPQPYEPLAGKFGVFSNINIDVTSPNGTVREFRIVNPDSGGNSRYVSVVAATGGDLTGAPYMALTPEFNMRSAGGAINVLPGPAAPSYVGVCRQSNCGPADAPFEEALAGGRLITEGTHITSAPPKSTSSSNATFEFVGHDGNTTVTSFECNLDLERWSPCSNPYRPFGLENGTHTLDVRYVTPAGVSDPEPARYVWTVDNGIPDVTRTWNLDNVRFDSGAVATGSFDYNFQPYNPLAGQFGTYSNINIDVTSLDGTVREFRIVNPGRGGNAGFVSVVAATGGDLTGAPYMALTPAIDMTSKGGPINVLPGPQDLSFIGVCRQSNCGPADGPYEEALANGRLTPEGTSITGRPASQSPSPDPTFRFTGFEGATRLTQFECRLDPDSWEPCSSPRVYRSLVNGTYTFEVRALDTLGNPDPVPATHTWTVDDGTPNQTRTWYLDNVRFDSGAVASGSFDYNTQPFNPAAAQFGTYSNINIDVTSPNGTVREFRIVNPASRGNARYVSVVAATGGDLTGAPYMALTPVFNMRSAGGILDILPGPADLSFIGVCRSSDCGPADAPYEEALEGGRIFTELPDTTAPVVTVFDVDVEEPGPSGATADFFVSAVDDIDGPLTPTCSSASGDLFPFGATTVTCEATDGAGNVGTASFVVTIEDTESPTASPVLDPEPNAAGWNQGDVTITWNWADTGSGIDPAQCSPSNFVVGQGEFPQLQSCVDLAGNVGIGRVEMKIDRIAPTATPTLDPAPNAAGWHRGDVAITWNWADDRSGIDVPQCFGSTLAIGVGEFPRLQSCVDLAGNVGIGRVELKVDRTEPDTTISSGPDEPVLLPGTSVIAFDGTDDRSGLAGLECRLDGGDWEGCASPATLPQLPNGDHTFEVRATDVAGNIESTPASSTWTVDIPTCLGKQATIIDSGRIRGTNGDDVIIGSDGRDIIDGRNGADTICALGGNDTVKGGNGDDRIDGGGGNDVVYAGGDDDIVTDPTGANRIFGQGGNDTLGGGQSSDRIDGGGGNDTIDGFGGNDTLNGGSGGDAIDGGTGNDRLNGGSGNDILRDRIGNDVLNGGGGNDRLTDLIGTNTHIGGSGRDDRCVTGPNDTVRSCETVGSSALQRVGIMAIAGRVTQSQ